MGRFFGRRPDPTPAVRRALRRRFLDLDEEVLAGVFVQRPGTNSAATSGAGDAGVSATTGVYAASSGGQDEDGKWLEWGAAAGNLPGVDPVVAKRAIFLTLALTDTRLLLVRRSRVLRGRHREVFASWLLMEIDQIKVPSRGSTLSITRGSVDLVFELPLNLKFLDPVYVELPTIFNSAQTHARRKEAGSSEPPTGDEL